MVIMKPDYTQNIDAILAGSPINVQAKLLGVNVNTLRRILIKHPDYEKAKAEGRLHSKGITPKLKEAAADSPAVAEVMAGATTTSVADKYGIPVASLTKMVHLANPGISLRYRGVGEAELAEKTLAKVWKTLEKFQATSHFTDENDTLYRKDAKGNLYPVPELPVGYWAGQQSRLVEQTPAMRLNLLQKLESGLVAARATAEVRRKLLMEAQKALEEAEREEHQLAAALESAKSRAAALEALAEADAQQTHHD